MSAINVSNILNAGFDQIFNLYNPVVYETGDIIDTYVYRAGLFGYAVQFCNSRRAFEIRGWLYLVDFM